VHWISVRCSQLVAEAEQIAAESEPELIVFSGWSSTGGPSEAEQMKALWRGPEIELVVEPTARFTAENASRTLPLLLEHGIDRAIVVCTVAHLLRAKFFFGRLYREHGVAVRFRAIRHSLSWRSISWEIGALPVAPAQLRAARAELARRLP
jgi:hypothetical protein